MKKRKNRVKPILALCILLSLLVSCNPNRAFSIFETAESLWESGKYKEALAHYAEVAEDYPTSPYAPKALYRTGIIQNLYLLQHNKAIDTFSRLIFLYPEAKESLNAQKEIASIYMDKLKDYKRAVFEFQKLLEAYESRRGVTEEEKGRIHFQVGLAYLQSREFEQARVEFGELLGRHPSLSIDPEVYLAISDSYFLEGRLKDAVDAYRKVITSYPDSPVYLDARFKLAISLEEQGELRSALVEYQKLIDNYPNEEVLLLKINGVKERINKEKRIKDEEAKDLRLRRR